MKEHLLNTLLYSGLSKETYNKYKSHVLKSDVRNLNRYLWVCGIGFLILGAVSAVLSSFTHENTTLYLSTALAFFVLLIAQIITGRLRGENSWVHTVLIYLAMAVIYTESIYVTLGHPDLPAVTYIGVLLILPLLFSQRAVYTMLMQTLSALAFCVAVSHWKTPSIAEVDIWNGVTFYAVSLLTIFIASPIRARSLIQAEVIRELSETDMLTGLKNRNSYEIYCGKASSLKTLPVCVYADVNGLHGLNNAKGHAAGDEMLKAVADCLRESIGSEYSYRLGGDEFLAFSFELSPEEAVRRISRMDEALQSRGYHVSFGFAAPESGNDLVSLISRAEKRMYEKKEEYYADSGYERHPGR